MIYARAKTHIKKIWLLSLAQCLCDVSLGACLGFWRKQKKGLLQK